MGRLHKADMRALGAGAVHLAAPRGNRPICAERKTDRT